MTWQTAILAALTPTERFASLRPADSLPPVAPETSWTLWVPLGVAGVCGLALVAWYLVQWLRTEKVDEFKVAANRIGLADEERAVLGHIAAAAGMKAPQQIFTMEEEFSKGLEAFLVSPQVSGMSDPSRQRLTQIVASLRKKLGFMERAKDKSAKPVQSVPIPAGCHVRISMPACPDQVEALVVQAGEDEVVVQLPVPLNTPPGQTWRLLCASLGTAWEFDAMVVETMPTGIRLKILGHPRAINHRRFVRAPTHRPIYMAPFSFVDETGQGKLPEFQQGTLVEIGGPGLRIHSKVQATPGDRMLVVVTLADKRVVRGVGTVRRCSPFWETVVEISGLKDSEMNELVRETLAALKEDEEKAEKAEGKSMAEIAAPAELQPAAEARPQADPLSTRN
ncbi:MAG: hypothetical protein NT049_03885 [Planctomycetota bacterium]|nr:hypothetical protein [Planctomycetota bacterium]